jgi:hydroxymethylglutaryl-CoA lyase
MPQNRPEIDVEISEVGPRDGLQIIPDFMQTDAKIAWIRAEAAAGVSEIEVCSFVPPKLVPQFVDAAAVVAAAKTVRGLTVAVLVPNLKGAENAVAAGADKLSFPLSVSRSHSMANVRKSPEDQLTEFRKIAEFVRALPVERRPKLSAGLSTAFGCTYEGKVAEADVVRLAVGLVEAGTDDLGLADTVGYADPATIRQRFRAVRQAVGEAIPLGAHLHNTMGLGLANALAALDVGVRAFDASLGGLGGCPFAPGATGNVVTEDLVFLFESMGLRTGVDLERLAAVRDIVRGALPNEPLYGHMATSGLPKGFAPAAGQGVAA